MAHNSDPIRQSVFSPLADLIIVTLVAAALAVTFAYVLIP